MRVSEIMTTSVLSVAPDTLYEDVVERMVRCPRRGEVDVWSKERIASGTVTFDVEAPRAGLEHG